MKYVEQSQRDALTRVQSFLTRHADVFAAVNSSTDRVTLDDVLDHLGEYEHVQSVRRVDATSQTPRIKAMCLSLRHDRMQPVATIVRAKLPRVPSMIAMSVPNVRAHVPALLESAGIMANAVEPYLGTLVEAGLQPDCVDQIRTAAAAIHEALRDRALDRGRWIGATAEIKVLLARGRAAVTVLDAAVVSIAHGNEALLAEWRTAKRVVLKPGPARKPKKTTQSAAVA